MATHKQMKERRMKRSQKLQRREISNQNQSIQLIQNKMVERKKQQKQEMAMAQEQNKTSPTKMPEMQKSLSAVVQLQASLLDALQLSLPLQLAAFSSMSAPTAEQELVMQKTHSVKLIL